MEERWIVMKLFAFVTCLVGLTLLSSNLPISFAPDYTQAAEPIVMTRSGQVLGTGMNPSYSSISGSVTFYLNGTVAVTSNSSRIAPMIINPLPAILTRALTLTLWKSSNGTVVKQQYLNTQFNVNFTIFYNFQYGNGQSGEKLSLFKSTYVLTAPFITDYNLSLPMRTTVRNWAKGIATDGVVYDFSDAISAGRTMSFNSSSIVFRVTGGSMVYDPVLWLEITGLSSNVQLYSGASIRSGQRLNTGNFTNGTIEIVRVSYRLQRTGSPTGTAVSRIRAVLDDSIISTSTTSLDVSTLTNDGSYPWVAFTHTQVTVNVNARFAVEYSGGNVSNYVQAAFSTGQGGNGVRTEYVASWTDYGSDHNIRIYTPNTAPNAPTINSPADASRVRPSVSVTFYWTFSDPDAGDTQSAYEIEIDNNSNFASPEVDSGKVISTTSSSAQTMPAAETTYYWRVRTWDVDDAIGVFSSGTITIKVDRVQVSSYTVTDTRVNINDDVNIDATLVFSSDSAQVTTGTITINTYSATHQGSGVWRITRTSSSVTQTTFNTVAATVSNITGVNQNGQSVAVTWDSVTIVITVGDSRVNVDVNASITVTATHTYDASSHSGVVTMNQTTFQFATVGIRGYTVSSITGGANGITTIGVNDSDNVIWDRVIMTARGNTDSRVDVGASSTVYFTLRFDYDDALITGGTVQINGTAATYNSGASRWELSVSQSSVSTYAYRVNSVSGNTYAITALTSGLNTNTTSVTWDKVSVGALTLSFQGVGVLRYTGTITYDSDSAGINGGVVTVQKPSGGNYGTFTANSVGSVTIDLNQPSLGVAGVYTVYVSGDSTYGITSRGTDRTFTLRKLTVLFKDFDGNVLNPDPSSFDVKQSGTILASSVSPLYVPDSLTYTVDGVNWKVKIVTPPTTPSIAISGSDGTLTITTLAPFSDTVIRDRSVKYKAENLPYVLKATTSVTAFTNSPGVLKLSMNAGSVDIKLPSNLYPSQVYGSSPVTWSVNNQILTVKVTGTDVTILFDEPSGRSTYTPPASPVNPVPFSLPTLLTSSEELNIQTFFVNSILPNLWLWVGLLVVGVFIVGLVRKGGKKRR